MRKRDVDRSGAHAAHAARQCHDRCGGDSAAAGRRRDREISWHPICCSIAPRRPPAWSRSKREPGIRCSPGRATSSARASCWRKASCTSPQPHEAVAAVRAAIPAEPWRLGAVSSITTLTGSGAARAGACAPARSIADAAWTAAHVDEDWQMSQWGRDELALERRAFREAEFQAAVAVLASS